MSVILTKPSRKPRMLDISLRAGVSIGTVSRVLNGKADVDPFLAERVNLAARELRYALRPSQRASQSETHELGPIAYLLDIPPNRKLTDVFQQNFLTGIEQRAGELKGHILFASCSDDLEQNRLPAIISDKLVRGAIIKGEFPDDWVNRVKVLMPAVRLMSDSPSRETDSVSCDNAAATYQIMRYLHGLGHRRVGFLYEKETKRHTSFHHLEREHAYFRCVSEMGFDWHPDFLQTPIRESGAEDLSEVLGRGLKKMLALKDRRPTALICTADIYAFSIMQVAGSLGLSVPRDLSVASYMNTPTCDYSNPRLTSVCLSCEELGRAAVDLLVNRMQNPSSLVQHITVAPRLVERHSCAKPPLH